MADAKKRTTRRMGGGESVPPLAPSVPPPAPPPLPVHRIPAASVPIDLGATMPLESLDGGYEASVRWEIPPNLEPEPPTNPMPAVRSRRSTRPPPPPLPQMPPRPTPGRTKAGGIELLVVEEHQGAGVPPKPWRAVEIWTKRRVYGCDSTFTCIEILDRETGKQVTAHEMLGARLGGGRYRDPMTETVRFAYPLPVPGTEAMFSKNKKHGYTSMVERTVMRVRVLTTETDAQPTWEEIAQRWSTVPEER